MDAAIKLVPLHYIRLTASFSGQPG